MSILEDTTLIFGSERELVRAPWTEQFLGPYVEKGQVIADPGCGCGSSTSALAERVWPEGNVYAVDQSKNCV